MKKGKKGRSEMCVQLTTDQNKKMHKSKIHKSHKEKHSNTIKKKNKIHQKGNQKEK